MTQEQRDNLLLAMAKDVGFIKQEIADNTVQIQNITEVLKEHTVQIQNITEVLKEHTVQIQNITEILKDHAEKINENTNELVRQRQNIVKIRSCVIK